MTNAGWNSGCQRLSVAVSAQNGPWPGCIGRRFPLARADRAVGQWENRFAPLPWEALLHQLQQVARSGTLELVAAGSVGECVWRRDPSGLWFHARGYDLISQLHSSFPARSILTATGRWQTMTTVSLVLLYYVSKYGTRPCPSHLAGLETA